MNLEFFRKVPDHFFVYLWLTLLVSWTALAPGYILTLDMAFAPNMNFFGSLDFSSPLLLWRVFVSLLNFILPAWLIQKLLIVLVFFVSGMAMHITFPSKNKWAKYFAGFLYMVNPFVYTRLLAGQLTHLLAYAFLPFLIAAFFALIKRQDLRNMAKVLLLSSLIAVWSLHILYMAAFLFTVLTLGYLWQNRSKSPIILKFLKSVFFITLSFVVLNFYWLLDFSAANSLDYFGLDHMKAFASSTDKNFGVLFNVLSMYGFWGESYFWGETVIWAKDILSIWRIIFFLLFALVIYGVISSFKNKTRRFSVFIFFFVGLCAFVFSVGLADSLFAGLNAFFYEYVPFFKGFREPQKWTALLVFSYAFLGAIGLENLMKKFSRGKMIAYLSYGLIFIYSFTMFGGFLGQLRPVFYPESWHEANLLLNEDKEDFRVIFLPWHRYMSFEFNNNRLVTNPADLFFDSEIIKADNTELGPIYSISESSESKLVENFLHLKDKNDGDLSKALSDLNAKYILYASDTADIEEIDYSFLENSSVLENVYQSEQLILYKFTGV